MQSHASWWSTATIITVLEQIFAQTTAVPEKDEAHSPILVSPSSTLHLDF